MNWKNGEEFLICVFYGSALYCGILAASILLMRWYIMWNLGK